MYDGKWEKGNTEGSRSIQAVVGLNDEEGRVSKVGVVLCG